MKFQYAIELKEGYKRTTDDETETELDIVVSAKNMATANRMIKALLKGAQNVIEYSGGWCIEE